MQLVALKQSVAEASKELETLEACKQTTSGEVL